MALTSHFKDLLADNLIAGADVIRSLGDWAGDSMKTGEKGGNLKPRACSLGQPGASRKNKQGPTVRALRRLRRNDQGRGGRRADHESDVAGGGPAVAETAGRPEGN